MRSWVRRATIAFSFKKQERNLFHQKGSFTEVKAPITPRGPQGIHVYNQSSRRLYTRAGTGPVVRFLPGLLTVPPLNDGLCMHATTHFKSGQHRTQTFICATLPPIFHFDRFRGLPTPGQVLALVGHRSNRSYLDHGQQK